MEQKGLSQEGLKLIACATMFIDHLGLKLGDLTALRAVGRLAFPIYCFLLVEGFVHTRSRTRYFLRLLLGAILAELPFDLLISGHWDPNRQSVMLTLLLGFVMLLAMEKFPLKPLRPVLMLPFGLIAMLLHTDYQFVGIVLIGIFAITRDRPGGSLLRLVCIGILFWFPYTRTLGFLPIRLEFVGILALIPIECYHGAKRTHSPAAQWAFYLFYPVHMLLLSFL